MNTLQASDEEFLGWLKNETESRWKDYRTRTIEAYLDFLDDGYDWQAETRWRGGISEDQLNQIQEKWHIVFPAGYSRFLRTLHTVDRPLIGIMPFSEESGQTFHIPWSKPPLFNWLADERELADSFQWPLEHVFFANEYRDGWLPSWGPKPHTLEAQNERIRELVRNGPQLIPIADEKYLLIVNDEVGQPVVSINPTSVALIARDWRFWLVLLCEKVLGISYKTLNQHQWSNWKNGDWFEFYRTKIPFWGEMLS